MLGISKSISSDSVRLTKLARASFIKDLVWIILLCRPGLHCVIQPELVVLLVGLASKLRTGACERSFWPE